MRKPHQPAVPQGVNSELDPIPQRKFGLAEPLKEALAPRAADIHAAFVYGSVAEGAETASSDVDLLVVSDTLCHADLFEILDSVERVLARRVNPTVMTLGEWQAARADADSFAARVSEGSRMWVIGSDDDPA